MTNITRLHAEGLTQFYFNLLILKTTYFQTQLITQLQPFFLSKKKKTGEGGRKNAAKREGEKAGGDQVSPERQSRRRSAFTKKQRLVRLLTTAIPPPHRPTGSDRLSCSLSCSDLSPIRQLSLSLPPSLPLLCKV